MTQPNRALTEQEVRRVLARTAELDATDVRSISVAALRLVAIEAGLAPEAFDRAVVELDLSPVPVPLPAAPRYHAVHATLKAVAVFGVAALVLIQGIQFFGPDWPLRHLANVVALAAGVVAAHRFRARLARTVFIGLGAAKLAQWAAHLAFGIGTLQGRAASVALLGAGLIGALGIALSARLERSASPSAPGSPAGSDSPAPAPSRQQDRAPESPRSLQLQQA